MVREDCARAVDGTLSRLLSLGTRIATFLIAVGCGFQLVLSRCSIAPGLSWMGVAIFVLLPGASVLTMSLLYLRQGQRALGAIAFAVLFLIIGGGTLVL